MDQPGKVVKPARGQLNIDNEHFPIIVCAWEIGLARRVRLSRPGSACSFPILGLNLVLTYGIPPDFRGGVHLFIPPYAIGPVRGLSGHAVAYRWHPQPTVRRYRTIVVLKVSPVMVAAFASPWTIQHTPIFSHTHY